MSSSQALRQRNRHNVNPVCLPDSMALMMMSSSWLMSMCGLLVYKKTIVWVRVPLAPLASYSHVRMSIGTRTEMIVSYCGSSMGGPIAI